MQHFYDDIKNGQLKPVYMLYGDEAYLMDEAVQALIAAAQTAGGAWGVEILDGGAIDPQTAVAAALESSLFGGFRLVLVKNINWLEAAGKRGALPGEEKDITAPLLAYIKEPNPAACLALTLRGTLDKRRKVAQALQKKGALIECATPQGAERDRWLTQHFLDAGLQADKRAIAHISVNCAYLSQMAAEADKLILYCGEKGVVTLADALETVAQGSLLTVFELTDAAAAKDAATACACYRRLLRQGEEIQKIFGLLASQFRNMLLTKDLLQQGVRPHDLARELGLHPYVAEKYTKSSRAFSQRQLIKVLEMLLAADIACKSGKGEMEEVLETVILRIGALK